MTSRSRMWRRRLLNVALPLLVATLTVLLLMRRLIFSPGYVIYRDLFPGQLYYRSLWHPQGSFMALENFKFVTFTGLFLPLQALGLDVYEKVVYVSAMAIAFLAFYAAAFRLLAKIRDPSTSLPVRHLASGLAALTYVANPAAANIFFDFSLFVGYAFAPLTLLLFMEMLDREQRWQAWAVGIAGLWWLSAIKAHWIVFGALLFVPPLALWGVWHWRSRGLRGVVRNLAATATVVVLYLSFSAYWLVPFVQASGERFVGSYAPMTVEAVAFLSYAPLWDTVRLLGSFQAWPYVRFEPPLPLLSLPWALASWAIPALALAGVVWFRRHWQVWTLAAFAIGGILLAKGVAPPLGGLYQSLVFGGLVPAAFRWLFRVASKWNVFLSLGYSGLAAFALAELATRALTCSWRHPLANRRAATAMLALAGTVVAVPLFAWPSFTGDMRGALVPVSLPKPMEAAYQWLAGQEGDFKVNWMPVTNGRELTWNPRPSGAVYASLSPQPSIDTNWNRHPVLYYSYAYDTLAKGQTANFGKLLAPLNTRYVAFHDDILTPHIHTGVEPVVVLLEGGEREWATRFTEQQDMRLAWQDDFVSIYEAAEVAPPLFVPQQVFLTTGDLSLLTSLSTLEGFHPAENAILFDASRNHGTFPAQVDGLLLKRDAADDLTFALLPAERLLAPAGQTIHGAVEQAWSRFDIYQGDWQFVLRDYGIVQWAFDYGQGMVAHASLPQASGPDAQPVLEVPARLGEPGRYHLWVRTLRHPNAGELLLSLDGRPFALLEDGDAITGFAWTDAGTAELAAGRHTIGLQNRDGFAAVNALALISEGEMANLEARRQGLAASVPNIYLLEAETDFDAQKAETARGAAVLSAGQAVVVKPGAPISTTLDLLLAGDYAVAVRAAMPPDSAPITVTLGTSQRAIHDSPPGGDLTWLTVDPVHLDVGSLPVRIEAAGDVVVDTFLLYTNSPALTPDALFDAPGPPAEIVYEQLDPTRYRVRVRTERSALVALAETYDPQWVASGPGLEAASVPLYGVINGFALDRAGTYELTVQFEPQQWARLGSFLTAAAVVGVGPLLLVTRRRRRKPQDQAAQGPPSP